jgi:hypothetical protein
VNWFRVRLTSKDKHGLEIVIRTLSKDEAKKTAIEKVKNSVNYSPYDYKVVFVEEL